MTKRIEVPLSNFSLCLSFDKHDTKVLEYKYRLINRIESRKNPRLYRHNYTQLQRSLEYTLKNIHLNNGAGIAGQPHGKDKTRSLFHTIQNN